MCLCADMDVPIIPRGAGISFSGAVLAVDGGVMIALTRMNRVLNIDPRNRWALVEAGCVNAWITRNASAHGLFYAPDPSIHTACTIGGNIATNSGGPHTLENGVTTNHVLGYEMVLPDSTIEWMSVEPDGGEEVAGFDLGGAAIGSEGMFGVVTRVLVRLMKTPPAFSAGCVSSPAQLTSRPETKMTLLVAEFISCEPYSLGSWMWGPQRLDISTCASVAVPARPPAQAECSTGLCLRGRANILRKTTAGAFFSGFCDDSSSSKFCRFRRKFAWVCCR